MLPEWLLIEWILFEFISILGPEIVLIYFFEKNLIQNDRQFSKLLNNNFEQFNSAGIEVGSPHLPFCSADHSAIRTWIIPIIHGNEFKLLKKITVMLWSRKVSVQYSS